MRYYRLAPSVLAGRYPGALDETTAQAAIETLIALGVETFIDLTEPTEISASGPLPPYAPLLPTGIQYVRIPTRDMTPPSVGDIQTALAVLRHQPAGFSAYVHCLGGCGRTGVVAGCYLVEEGFSGSEALERVRALSLAALGRTCPETQEQRDTVLAWRQWLSTPETQ